MRYYILLALLSAASYCGATVLASLAVRIAWARVWGLLERSAAACRARRLAVLRLLPSTAGLAAALAFAGVFFRFEPPNTAESPGVLLVLFAGGSACLVAASLLHAWGRVRGTMRYMRLVRHCPDLPEAGGVRVNVVETAYPVAALCGIFRPRILVSSSILAECEAAEIDAVLRHEVAHLRRRDNITQALMALCADPLRFTATARDIERHWAAAAEQAADDDAAGSETAGRTVLASALVRVAQMARREPPSWMPGLAFYEGLNLETRVRRLLAPGQAPQRGVLPAALVGALALLTVILVRTDALARGIHGWMESAVQHLP